MVLTPRRPFDHVAMRDIIKRQSTCDSECSASLAVLQASDVTTFCTDSFIDGFQTCMNCLASSSGATLGASYFTNLKSTIDSISTSCATLGKPVTHSVTIPPLGAVNTGAANTGTPNTGTGTKTGTNPTNTSKANTQEDQGPPVGAIVGGVVGGIALIVVVGLLVFFIKRRKNNQPAPAGSAYIPGGPTSDPNKETMAPPLVGGQGYYPVPQSGTPPPQMQQYNNMGGMPAGGQAGAYNPNAQTPWLPQGPAGNMQYGQNQFNPTSSYAATTGPSVVGAQQYGQPQMNQNFGQAGFAAGAMHDNRTSTYAPSTYTTSTNAPYQPTLSPGPVGSIASSGSQRLPVSPPASSSQAPLIPPQQYPITESYTHANLPSSSTPAPGTHVESPPAYEGANLQPGGASGPAPLSQQEVELISQRVANIMNANGQAPDAGHIGKLVGEQRKN